MRQWMAGLPNALVVTALRCQAVCSDSDFFVPGKNLIMESWFPASPAVLGRLELCLTLVETILPASQKFGGSTAQTVFGLWEREFRGEGDGVLLKSGCFPEFKKPRPFRSTAPGPTFAERSHFLLF